MEYQAFMESLDANRVTAAIQRVESSTTGEVRVCVARSEEPDALAAARRAFDALNMQATRDRNGVLLFVAPKSQTFAIVGDEGIDRICGAEFWAGIARDISGDFAAGRPTDALERAIAAVGEVLEQHFPKHADDADELPNDIVTL
jgi:uncharacterized membrane protein